MSTFSLSLASLAIVAVWLHIFEEAARGFRQYLNLQVTGCLEFPARKDGPVDAAEGFFKDQLGLGSLLSWLIWMGTTHPWAAGIAVGIIAADVAQHGLLSIAAGMRYTPGLGTCALYAFILWQFPWDPGFWQLWVMAGAALIIGNFLFVAARSGGRAS